MALLGNGLFAKMDPLGKKLTIWDPAFLTLDCSWLRVPMVKRRETEFGPQSDII